VENNLNTDPHAAYNAFAAAGRIFDAEIAAAAKRLNKPALACRYGYEKGCSDVKLRAAKAAYEKASQAYADSFRAEAA
jgi:hypothetical protein